jgi:cell division septal protein FtsQ
MLDSVRRLGLAVVFIAVATSAYFLLVRDASLFAVDHVRVVGLRSPERANVRAALRDAAEGMTTLHVEMGKLNEAVRPYPVVKAIAVDTDFPSRMTIRVTENVPVGIIRGDGRRLPVAVDGRILEGVPLKGRSLPALRTDSPALLRVLGAAPPSLLRRAASAFVGPRGIVVVLRRGPRLYFHGPERAAAKWRAVARVLADPKTGQSSYIDLQLPSRPALGGARPPAPTETAPPAAAPPVITAPPAAATSLPQPSTAP